MALKWNDEIKKSCRDSEFFRVMRIATLAGSRLKNYLCKLICQT